MRSERRQLQILGCRGIRDIHLSSPNLTLGSIQKPDLGSSLLRAESVCSPQRPVANQRLLSLDRVTSRHLLVNREYSGEVALLRWAIGAASALVLIGGSAQAGVILQVTGLVGVNTPDFSPWYLGADGNEHISEYVQGLITLAAGTVSDPFTQSIPEPAPQVYTITFSSPTAILSTQDTIEYKALDYIYNPNGAGWAYYTTDDNTDWEIATTPSVTGDTSTEQFVAQETVETFPLSVTGPQAIQRYQGFEGYLFNETIAASAIGQPFTFTVSTSVPEPATWGMLVMGVFGLGAVLRRRRGGVETSLTPSARPAAV